MIRILQGDVLACLDTIPDESVHCVVTSPPYWGLRDYGVVGQIGLEGCMGEHMAVLVDVFREVRRVLRSDGTLWLNYGDCYATSPNGRSAADTKAVGNDDRTFRDKPFSTIGPVLRHSEADAKRGHNSPRHKDQPYSSARVEAGGYMKPKDRLGLPHRLVFALQDDGWYWRDEIVWAKSNPMPSSVKDRTTSSHEFMFMLSKKPRYFYDNQAIKEPIAESSKKRYAQPTIDMQNGGAKQDAYEAGFTGQRARSRRPNEIIKSLAADGQQVRQRRSVWVIPTKPFPEAHFATFPPALIEPCIKAGSPAGGGRA